ncbi:MAG: hypothetical protein DRJ03_31200 [Chloroflexi bacterium]|nr:MAG: hypothetical protein DRJ03_31200 [Chloroflexota bacterium]
MGFLDNDPLWLENGLVAALSIARKALRAGDYPHLTAERAEVAEIVKKVFSACFAASAVKENRINAVTFEHVGNHQSARYGNLGYIVIPFN